MVANIIFSDMLNATWVKCHLVAFKPGGNYQGNLFNTMSNTLVMTRFWRYYIEFHSFHF